MLYDDTERGDPRQQPKPVQKEGHDKADAIVSHMTKNYHNSLVFIVVINRLLRKSERNLKEGKRMKAHVIKILMLEGRDWIGGKWANL